MQMKLLLISLCCLTGFANAQVVLNRQPIWLGSSGDCNHAIFSNANEPCGTASPTGSDDSEHVNYFQGLVFQPRIAGPPSYFNSSGDFILQGKVGIGSAGPTEKLFISSGSLSFDRFGYVSSYRGPSNSYTNLFLGGGIVDVGNGSYSVKSDGGSNYFAAIRMDSTGGNVGAIAFYSGATTGGSEYALTNAQLASYQRMSIVGGNVGIGTSSPAAKLDVAGNVKISGTGSSITFPDGSIQSVAWTGTLCGGDYAESMDAVGDRTLYQPGDVLVISDDATADVARSKRPYSTMVSGIYSTKPGMVGRRQQASDKTTEVPMAMIGVVPTKVTAENGAIKRGDLLVTSSLEGYAMKGTDHKRMLGAVIGKALGTLDAGTGTIEVLVTLQ